MIEKLTLFGGPRFRAPQQRWTRKSTGTEPLRRTGGSSPGLAAVVAGAGRAAPPLRCRTRLRGGSRALGAPPPWLSLLAARTPPRPARGHGARPLRLHPCSKSPLRIHPRSKSPMRIHPLSKSPVRIHPRSKSPVRIHPLSKSSGAHSKDRARVLCSHHDPRSRGAHGQQRGRLPRRAEAEQSPVGVDGELRIPCRVSGDEGVRCTAPRCGARTGLSAAAGGGRRAAGGGRRAADGGRRGNRGAAVGARACAPPTRRPRPRPPAPRPRRPG
jgi:hypothetical protein